MSQQSMRVDEITVGPRHRKDLGDLRPLAESIRRRGLLHPPVVTPGKVLVAGQRRLAACRELLRWEEIPVRVLDVDSLLLAERDENDLRKDFTPSERVAIAEAVCAATGERRGKPSGHTKGREKEAEDIQDDCPEYPKGVQTREVAARAAGFSSDLEFRRARKVLERGTPEVVRAMDEGEVPISRADTIARLPSDEQGPALEEAKGRRRGRPRKSPPPSPELFSSPPPPPNDHPVTDGRGQAVPPALAPVFAARKQFTDAIRLCHSLAGVLDGLASTPGGAAFARRCGRKRKAGRVVHRPPQLVDLEVVLRDCSPYAAPCPRCQPDGGEPKKDCTVCFGLGWVMAKVWHDMHRQRRPSEEATR